MDLAVIILVLLSSTCTILLALYSLYYVFVERDSKRFHYKIIFPSLLSVILTMVIRILIIDIHGSTMNNFQTFLIIYIGNLVCCIAANLIILSTVALGLPIWISLMKSFFLMNGSKGGTGTFLTLMVRFAETKGQKAVYIVMALATAIFLSSTVLLPRLWIAYILLMGSNTVIMPLVTIPLFPKTYYLLLLLIKSRKDAKTSKSEITKARIEARKLAIMSIVIVAIVALWTSTTSMADLSMPFEDRSEIWYNQSDSLYIESFSTVFDFIFTVCALLTCFSFRHSPWNWLSQRLGVRGLAPKPLHQSPNIQINPGQANTAPNLLVTISKRKLTGYKDGSVYSQVTVQNTETTTINLTKSNEEYTLFVPGYLKFNWELDFEQIKSLGKGATGTVYEAKALKTSFISSTGVSIVAIKSMPFVVVDAFLFEVAINRLLSNHRNIVAFFGYLQSPNGMIMELCDGTLGDLIFLNPKTIDDLKMETIIAAATDICQGCAHLHQHDIVYFDLKTANVLFKRTASGIVCKVADFGYARLVDTNGSSDGKARLVSGLEIPTEFGYTPRYCAPEMLDALKSENEIQYTRDHFKCDVYSFGIILYELLNGVKAWSDEGGFDIKYVRLRQRPKIIDRFKRTGVEVSCSKEIGGLTLLIEKCWSLVPLDRPEFNAISEQLNFRNK